jgi:hypothetical protein
MRLRVFCFMTFSEFVIARILTKTKQSVEFVCQNKRVLLRQKAKCKTQAF